MTLEDFKTLQDMATEELALPDTFEGMEKKNRLQPTVVQKWTKLCSRQKYVVNCLNIELLEMQGNLEKCYKFPKSTKDLQQQYGININEYWDKGKEIESQINTIPCYIAKVKEVNTQKYILDYIERTLDDIHDMAFSIKNYLEFKKMLTTSYT